MSLPQAAFRNIKQVAGYVDVISYGSVQDIVGRSPIRSRRRASVSLSLVLQAPEILCRRDKTETSDSYSIETMSSQSDSSQLSAGIEATWGIECSLLSEAQTVIRIGRLLFVLCVQVGVQSFLH